MSTNIGSVYVVPLVMSSLGLAVFAATNASLTLQDPNFNLQVLAPWSTPTQQDSPNSGSSNRQFEFRTVPPQSLMPWHPGQQFIAPPGQNPSVLFSVNQLSQKFDALSKRITNELGPKRQLTESQAASLKQALAEFKMALEKVQKIARSARVNGGFGWLQQPGSGNPGPRQWFFKAPIQPNAGFDNRPKSYGFEFKARPDAGDIVKSLTTEQSATMKSRGYLHYSELSDAQKKLVPQPRGDFELHFKTGDQELVIKN